MELVHHLDVPYLRPLDASQTFDIYVPKYSVPDTLVCFVHGGAWRTEDKADHAALARSLAISTGYPVALPNYRLTPTVPTPDHYLHHPAHAEDVLRFLEFVLVWDEENGGRLPRKPSKLFLIGHSCSAHMLSAIFLRMPHDPESLCPSDNLVQSTAAIIMSEGIYDIDLLLSSFPNYRTWFIEHAFGKRDSFENLSAITAAVDPRSPHIHWFLIHSKGDTLVNESQSEGMYYSLRERSCLVSRSFEDLEDEHNDILKSSQYIGIIDRYIKGVVGAREYHLTNV